MSNSSGADKSAPLNQRDYFERVVKELNLDTSDTFTLLLANAFALADQRDALKAQLATRSHGAATTYEQFGTLLPLGERPKETDAEIISGGGVADQEIIAAFSAGASADDKIPTHQPHAPLLTNEQIIWVVRRFMAGSKFATPSSIGTPAGWTIGEERDGLMVVSGPLYRSRESAESDAKLPRARGVKAEVYACVPAAPSASATSTPWQQCEFSIIAWEIDQGQIGISVKHEKGGSAWVVKPVDHVEKLLRDGLRYRWLRGATTDYTPMCEQALCLEALDEWIDAQISKAPDGGHGNG